MSKLFLSYDIKIRTRNIKANMVTLKQNEHRTGIDREKFEGIGKDWW